MGKKIFLLLALLWELFRAAGLFFTVTALLNPAYRIETSLMLGWLFIGSLTVFALEAMLFFRGPGGPGADLPLSAAALGKFVSAIPGIMLFFLLSGSFEAAAGQGPFLMGALRPVIGIVCFLDLICAGFLLLLQKRGKAGEEE